MMKREERRRICRVWLFLAVFTLPFVFQPTHIYYADVHTEHHCSDQSHTHHDCNTCPVCRFTLAAFTEVDFVVYDFTLIPFDFKPVVSLQDNIFRPLLIPYGLRAPPALA